jgi:hypothetical protein
VAVLALAGLVVGCADPAPEVKPPPPPAEPPPVVQSVQVERILRELSAELDQAVADSSAEPLTQRVGGAALTMIEAQYAAKAANPDEKIFALGTRFAGGQVVARSELWPRSFAVFTEAGDTEAPFVYQLEQADARSPYKLVLWAQMLAGAKMPNTVKAGVGSDVVDPGSQELKMSPIAAVQAYAAAKDDPTGAQAQAFDTVPQDGADPDPVRARWTILAKAYRDQAAMLAGATVESPSAMVEGSVSALATADFGALVFAQVQSVIDLNFTPAEGVYLDIGAAGYTGLGATGLRATKSVHVEHLQTLVLAIPPEGSDQPIKVIAVADVPTAARVE